MTTKANKKDSAGADLLFVLGLDEVGKPRGARFKEHLDRTVSIALDMKLTCIHPASTAFAELGVIRPFNCGLLSITFSRRHDGSARP